MRTLLNKVLWSILRSKPFHYAVVIACFLVVLRMRVLIVQAKSFHVGQLPQREISLSKQIAARRKAEALAASKGYWQLPGGNPHQNKVLKLYQDALKAKGVTDQEALHYGAAVLISENEPLTLDRLGDSGHAFGICQKSVRPQYAKDFLKKHPEWKTVEKQIDFCTQRFADAWARFKSLTAPHRIVTPKKEVVLVPEGVFRAAVENNCPACSRAGVDSTRANHKPLVPSYFNRVHIAAAKLFPL
jgi:hypothetical protein